MANLGVIRGNILATATLIALVSILLVVAVITIIIPLGLKRRTEERKTPLAKLLPDTLYFSLIGSGFMLVEIALIQRLSVFLSQPIYALGIILFTIILSTGIGSFISEYLPLTRKPWIFVYPLVTAAVVLAARFVLLYMLQTMIESPLSVKIVASV